MNKIDRFYRVFGTAAGAAIFCGAATDYVFGSVLPGAAVGGLLGLILSWVSTAIERTA